MNRLDGWLAAKGKLWARVVSVQGDQVILAVANRRLAAKTTVSLTEGDVVALTLGSPAEGEVPLRVTARRAGGVSPENAGLPQVVLRLPAGLKTPGPGEVLLARVLQAQGREGLLRLLGVDSPAVSDVPLAKGDVLPLLWEGGGGERAMLRLLPQAGPSAAPRPSLGGALERAGWPGTGGNLALARALRAAGLPVNAEELTWLNRVASAGTGGAPSTEPGPGAGAEPGPSQGSPTLDGAITPAGVNREGIAAAARLRAENPNVSLAVLGGLVRVALAEDLGKRLAGATPNEELFFQPGNAGRAEELARVVARLFGGGAGDILAQAGPAGPELAAVLLYHHFLSAGSAVCVGIPLVWAKEPGSAQLRVEREAAGRRVNPRQTAVRLSLEAPRLGPVQVVLDFNGKRITAKFVADGEDSARILAAGAGFLQNRLEKLDFTVGTLRFTTVAAEDAKEDKSLDQRV